MISVIAPVYNEEDVIADFIKAVRKARIEKLDNYELIIIDDGSIDATFTIAKKLAEKDKKIRLVSYKPNKGFGYALKEGIKAAKGNIIITMDSDLTHPPSFIPRLIAGLKKTKADVCIASRYIKGGWTKNVSASRVFISKIANLFFSFFYSVHDVTAGFKAYKTKKLKSINITKKDFSVQLEIMTKLARKKAKFCEVPFVLVSRKKGKSKFKPVAYLKYFISILSIFLRK